MRTECSIVKDLFPLYIENMVSEDSACFIEKHINECNECAGVCNKIKENNLVLDVADEDSKELISSLRKIRKKFWKRACIIALAVCLAVAIAVMALQIFPVYRVFQNDWDNTFTISERKMLAFIGTPSDRKVAKSVINQAEIVFSDISHTYEENMEKYGVLGRYAFQSHMFGEYFDAVAEKHEIKLLSARIYGNHGYMFVEYSHEAIDSKGETVSGSWDIVSLWEIEKDSNGDWFVINIKEHA